MTSLILRLPPPLNSLYRRAPGGHGMYKTAEAKEWAEECQWEFKKAKGVCIVRGGVDIHMRLFVSRDRDIDSCFKLVLDSLEEFAYLNDSQVTRLIAYKEVDKSNPRIEIDIMSPLDKQEEDAKVSTEASSQRNPDQ